MQKPSQNSMFADVLWHYNDLYIFSDAGVRPELHHGINEKNAGFTFIYRLLSETTHCTFIDYVWPQSLCQAGSQQEISIVRCTKTLINLNDIVPSKCFYCLKLVLKYVCFILFMWSQKWTSKLSWSWLILKWDILHI